LLQSPLWKSLDQTAQFQTCPRKGRHKLLLHPRRDWFLSYGARGAHREQDKRITGVLSHRRRYPFDVTILKSLLGLKELWNSALGAIGQLIYSFAGLWHSASDEEIFRVRATGLFALLFSAVEIGYLSFAHPQFSEALRSLWPWGGLSLHLWLDLSFGLVACTVATWWVLGRMLALRRYRTWLALLVTVLPVAGLALWWVWPPSVAADQLLQWLPMADTRVRHAVEWVIPILYAWCVLPAYSYLVSLSPASHR
jgi:hypothetical protein